MQSAAGTDKMYATGDAITVRVTFPKTIQSAMGASLNIQIGDNTRAAAASDCSNCGTTYLDFSYTVAAGDYDANGVTVETDALSATALTHSHAGTPHAFTLTLPNTLARPQANHRVNLGDYDQDDDGLIEVSTLDHLNAIRWDLDGDGGVSSANATNYSNAFLSRSATMGCPTNSQDADNNDCAGYELAENLDFDTDGDGDVDSNDDYSNWTPIPSFGNTFEGNGKTISNLSINSSVNNVGLFATLANGSSSSKPGVVRSLGMIKPSISGNTYVGAIAGSTNTASQASWKAQIIASYALGGEISATAAAGGLVGNHSGIILASYAATVVSAANYAGGLVGVRASGNSITAGYAAGPVSVTGTGAGGISGLGTSGTISATYWDTNVTGIADDSDTNMPEGKTTSELQSITGYTAGSVYADWNVNVDGQTGADDPWDFGEAMQYPMLKFDGMSVVAQGSLAMGRPALPGNNHPIVGQDAAVCLVNGPSIRAPRPRPGGEMGKQPWIWQRSPDGKTWTNITEDGGPTYYYMATSADLNNYLRACVALGDNAPEGADEACVRMFAKTQAAASP